ncbi:MAG: YjbQ family protein [Rhizobiales bacterium]|nr:YjbQ family protein [Hyphomicrobiales bacterium]
MLKGHYRPLWHVEQKLLEQRRTVLEVATRGKRMHDITDRVAAWLAEVGAQEGLLTVFLQHTSASLTIQENADPTVQSDLLDALERLAPEDGGYRRRSEGPDDMPAHIKAMLTSVSLAIPVIDASMALGTWQGVYLVEHRAAPHARNVVLHFVGSVSG